MRIEDVTGLPAGSPDRATQPKLVSRKIGQNNKEGNKHEETGEGPNRGA